MVVPIKYTYVALIQSNYSTTDMEIGNNDTTTNTQTSDNKEKLIFYIDQDLDRARDLREDDITETDVLTTRPHRAWNVYEFNFYQYIVNV